jgi:hypothetical protein
MSSSPHAMMDREKIEMLKSELLAKQLHILDHTALAWLALVPEWTEELAAQAGFPTGGMKLEDFLSSAQEVGICERDKGGSSAEIARLGARALMAIWQRMNDSLKRKYSAVLIERAELLPPGAEKRRMLREAEAFSSPRLRSSLSRLTDFLTSVGGASGHKEQQDVVEVLLSAIEDFAQRGSRREDLTSLTKAAANLLGSSIIPNVLAKLDQIGNVAVVLSALAALASEFPDDGSIARSIEVWTHGFDSEDRAQMLLYVAPKNGSALGRKLQREAVDGLKELQDPATRAAALLNATLELDDQLRIEVIREVLGSARLIEAPSLRGQIIAATLPFLDLSERANEGRTLAQLSESISDPRQKTTILAAAASGLAQGGQDAEAAALARSAIGEIARAQIFLETVPELQQGKLDRLREAIGSLQPSELEQVLSSASQEASKEVALLDPGALRKAIDSAVSAGRFSTACKLAGLFTGRFQSLVIADILKRVEAIASLKDRLQAIADVAAFVPENLVEAASTIATAFRVSTRFSIAEYSRADIVEFLRKDNGRLFVSDAAVAAGTAISKILPIKGGNQSAIDIPSRTVRWSILAAQCGNPIAAGAFITDHIRAALDSGAIEDALEILDSAVDVASIVGAELEPAVAMGRHRIQLTFRESADERRLSRYLPRQEQIDDFVALIDEPDGPDSHYALHYLGAGGVGKTMLLRYIAGRLAMRDGQNLPTTRIDFDHISPDYPARKPGELLAALADELRLWGGPDQESRFSTFMADLSSVHAALAQERLDDEDPLSSLRSDLFRMLLDKFAALLTDLPKPVIFILDTCEELVKLEPVGSKLASIEATFLILEELHNRVNQMRVVFAGRRLLAQAGDTQPDGLMRWSAEVDSHSGRNRMLPDKKGYLRLHVVRGFTETEADSFLTRIAQLDLDERRRKAILGSSADVGSLANIAWNQAPSIGTDEGERYNPFDISLYAEWVREVPNLSIEMIESRDTDPYVETRIEGRIFDENIRSALPAVVLMRRFNLEMLREVVNEDVVLQVYRDLGGQEWVDYQPDALQLDLNLLPRLNHYFQNPSRRHSIETARASLGPALGRMVRDGLRSSDPFGRLNVALVDAALRLLPSEEATAIWDDIDRKICTETNWNWAENLCRFLLEEGNAAACGVGTPAAPNPLRPAVRATMAAAKIHRFPFQPAVEWWKEVASTSSDHPDPDIRAWLLVRARLAFERLSPEIVRAVADLRAGDPWRYEQAVAAFAAAIERHLEENWEVPKSDFIERDDTAAPEIRAFLAGMHASSKVGVKNAKRLLDATSRSTTRQRWADWHAPVSVRDRVRLELLRHGGIFVSRAEMRTWSSEASSRLDNSDSERLISRLLQLWLYLQLPDIPDLDADSAYDPNRLPLCSAARDTPALFSSLADALIARGNFREASLLLQRVLSRVTSASDNEAIAAIGRSTLRLKRRMRSPDALSNLPELIGLEQPWSARFHRWWVGQVAMSQLDTENLIAAAVRQGPDALRVGDGRADYDLALDARELDLLGERIGRPTDYASPLLEGISIDGQDLRTALRRTVLTTENPPEASEFPRLDATIAMEEGELLALRLPKIAQILFHFAATRFAEANDPVGELQASICFNLARVEDRAKYDDAANASVTLDLQDPYEKCRNHGVALPDWVEANTYEAQPTAPAHPWDGWLRRITYLNKTRADNHSQAWREIAAVYNNVPQFDIGMTVEGEPAEKQVPAMRKAIVVLCALGLGVAVTAPLLVVHDRSLTLLIGAFDVVVGALLCAIAMAPRLLYIEFCHSVPRILIQPSYSNSMSVLIRFEVKRGLGPFFRDVGSGGGGLLVRFLRGASVFRKWFDFSDAREVEQLGYQPYAAAADKFSRFYAALHAIQRSILLGPLPVALRIDRSIARFAWEAALSLAVPASSLGEPQFVRLEGVLSDEAANFEKWKRAGILVDCRPELASVMEKAWRTSGRPLQVRARTSKSIAEDNAVGVNQVVGTATRTASGTRFSLQGPESMNKKSVSFDVRSFSHEHPAVFIVQEEPAERLRRLDIDREQTADARSWATELFYSGQQCVILIPTLPLALAQEVIQTVAQRLGRSDLPDLYRLIQLVREIRNKIRRFRPPRDATGTLNMMPDMSQDTLKATLKELSLEVTLFARSRVAHEEDRFTGFAT